MEIRYAMKDGHPQSVHAFDDEAKRFAGLLGDNWEDCLGKMADAAESFRKAFAGRGAPHVFFDYEGGQATVFVSTEQHGCVLQKLSFDYRNANVVNIITDMDNGVVVVVFRAVKTAGWFLSNVNKLLRTLQDTEAAEVSLLLQGCQDYEDGFPKGGSADELAIGKGVALDRNR